MQTFGKLLFKLRLPPLIRDPRQWNGDDGQSEQQRSQVKAQPAAAGFYDLGHTADSTPADGFLACSAPARSLSESCGSAAVASAVWPVRIATKLGPPGDCVIPFLTGAPGAQERRMEAKEEDWGQPVAPVVAAYRALTPPPGLQYESARSRSKFAIGGVAILMIGLCAQIVLNIFLISQLTGGGAAGFDDGDMPVSAILAILFMVFTIVIGYVAGSVCFSMWFHRAYRNLPTLVNGQLLTTPGWAVGSFFIPFLNLFRPYQ